MTSSAVIATQLTSTTAYPYALYMGSLNVIRPPSGSGTNGYNVPYDSIDLTEVGPGGASAFSFTINDPAGVVPTPSPATPVQFWDLTNAMPLFSGFIQDRTLRPWPPGGRYIDITAIGIEAVLDWMLVPSLTITAGAPVNQAIQSIIANATGIGVTLNATSSTTDNGNQANPIGDLGAGGGALVGMTIVLAGETVREAIRKVLDSATSLFSGVVAGVATVDFYGGVRVWSPGSGVGAVAMPNDYAALAIVDTAGAFTHAANLNHEFDDTGVERGVFIQGGNAAGTGLVSDGSGIPGHVALLNDTSILTGADRDLAASAYLADKAPTVRGAFTIETFSPTTNIRAGSDASITDAEVGLSAAHYVVASIRKTFQGGGSLQTWEVAYGGLRPSAMRHLRRLTRYVRS